MHKLIYDNTSKIFYYKWLVDNPSSVFILIHGMGAHTGRWDFFAEYLLNKNISSYAIELKGFGQTEYYKGHIDSLNTYYKDILSLVEIAKRENPNKKIIISGESMGGLLAFELYYAKQNLFDALVCFSPAFANNMKLPYLKMVFSLLFNPKNQFIMPFTSKMCTSDIEYQNQMDLDPREHRFATPYLLLQLLFAQIRSIIFAKKIQKPVLFLLAGDEKDLLVNPKAAKLIFNLISSKDKKLIQYNDMLHALTIEKERQKVFNDVLDWVNKTI